MGCVNSLMSIHSFMANFCCSIELEPRTLNQGQLDQAREVAVGIIQKEEEPTKVSNLFVERLKPPGVAVLGLHKKEEEEVDCSSSMENAAEINEGTVPCQCSCDSISSPILDSPLDQSKFKEPLSAPF